MKFLLPGPSQQAPADGMDALAWLAISAIFVNSAVCQSADSYVLDIVLQSGRSASSRPSINGKAVDVLIDDDVTLVATWLMNITANVTQGRLDWSKNGQPATKLSGGYLPFKRCSGSPPYMNCSFALPLSNTSGISGNYTVEASILGTRLQIASTVITPGSAQPLEFTSLPGPEINCSATNAAVVLSYRASGFPRPVYSVNCSGASYESGPSESGLFILPPALCNGPAICQATASNGYHSPVLSSATRLVPPPDTPGCVRLPQSLGSAAPGHAFLRCPPAVITTDSYVFDGTLVLWYSAVGARHYGLRCSYSNTATGRNFSSDSGNFTLSSLQCGVNATCYAVANVGGDDIASPATILLGSSSCGPVVEPVKEGQPGVILMASTIAPITVALAVTTTLISCWRGRRCRLFHQRKFHAGSWTTDVRLEHAVDDNDKCCLNERDANVSREEVPLDPSNVFTTNFCEVLNNYGAANRYTIGMAANSQPSVAQFSRDETHCLETDCGDSSVIGARQPSYSAARLTGDCGASAKCDCRLQELCQPATSSPAVIFISATNVQLGNCNTMIVNDSSADHISFTWPESSPGVSMETENGCIPGIITLPAGSTLSDFSCSATNDDSPTSEAPAPIDIYLD